MKVDSLCDAYLRVNLCVTEQRDMNNVPTMMYTPNKEDYIQEMKIRSGLNQELPFSKFKFKMSAIRPYELFSVFHTYYPLVISMNYQRNKQLYAFINYGNFTKDGNGNINGAHITKQLVLVRDSFIISINNNQTNILILLDKWDSL
jgi:hypothetical protein